MAFALIIFLISGFNFQLWGGKRHEYELNDFLKNFALAQQAFASNECVVEVEVDQMTKDVRDWARESVPSTLS